MSPSRIANYSLYCRLSLLSCTVVQGTLWVEDGVPPEIRSEMEELCRTMQSFIVDQLPNVFRFFNGSIMYAVRCAIQFVYTDIKLSRHTMYQDEAEACKPIC